MSRVIYLLNDELREFTDVGQGYDGFWLWTADQDDNIYTDPLNYFANKAFDTNTSVRFVDEHYFDTDEGSEIYRDYYRPSLQEMSNWLQQRSKYWQIAPNEQKEDSDE